MTGPKYKEIELLQVFKAPHLFLNFVIVKHETSNTPYFRRIIIRTLNRNIVTHSFVIFYYRSRGVALKKVDLNKVEPQLTFKKKAMLPLYDVCTLYCFLLD
jgi:hypothetical protein